MVIVENTYLKTNVTFFRELRITSIIGFVTFK